MFDKKRGLICFFVMIMLIGLVSASIQFKGIKLSKDAYNEGETLQGTLNLSATSQKNANFTSTFKGGIDLLGLLEKSEYELDENYSCNPSNCERGLTASSGGLSRTISLSDEKMLGFMLTGDNVDVSNFKFRVGSDVASSCINQLSMDLFDDGEIDFYNNKYVDELCGVRSYGCFVGPGTTEVKITNELYCENITFEPAPAYKIGAKIKKVGIAGDINMEVYKADGTVPVADCTLPAHPGGEVELDCVVNYSSQRQFDALVCVYVDNELTDFKIKAETTAPCGKRGVNSAFTADYEIYAQRMRYGTINSLFNESVFEDLNPDETDALTDKINDYLYEKYAGECPESSGCVIPISLSSTSSQEVTLDSALIKYSSIVGDDVEADKIYDVSEKDVEITTTGFLKFDFKDLGISAVGSSGQTKEFLFKLFFDGSNIFEDTVDVTAGFNFGISPSFALIGTPVEFTANVTGVDSTWDFGDGSADVNSGDNKAVHTYLDSGDYDVEVTLRKLNGDSSTKTFKITVGDAEESARSLISRYKSRIANLTVGISSFPAWMKIEIEKSINLTSMNKSLSELEDEFDDAEDDDDFVDVVNGLLVLNVPNSIGIGKSGTLPIETGLGGIDTNYIETISGKDIPSTQEAGLKASISGWMSSNYDTDVDFEAITLFKDSGSEDIIGKYKIVATKKGNPEGAYLIIDYPLNEITFKENYGAKSTGTGTYIDISGTKTVEFILPEYVEIEELGAYISPEVDKFGTLGEVGFLERGFPWGRFVLWMSILIVLALLVYVILQEWYKRYYEQHLFKGRKDQIYNLINFIYNARASGMEDKDIGEKLRGSGWSREQIRYAFRKLDGKRTGMWEIPIFKFFENKRVKDEIAKRHAGVVNQRYVGM